MTERTRGVGVAIENDDVHEVLFVYPGDLPEEIWRAFDLAGEPGSVGPTEAESVSAGDGLIAMTTDGANEYTKQAFVVESIEGDEIRARSLDAPDQNFVFDRTFVSEQVAAVIPSELLAALDL